MWAKTSSPEGTGRSLTPVTFTYDLQGRLTQTMQATPVSAITYDASGRPAAMTDALTRAVSFTYEAADRVTTQTLLDARASALPTTPTATSRR